MDHSIPQCGIDLIKEFEGYEKKLADGRAEAYPDPIRGWKVPTIGWGSTKKPDGSPVCKGDVITPDQATAYMMAELEKVCRPALEKIPTWGEMNANQRGALYSFAYNLGAHFHGGANFQSITEVCDSPERWLEHDWVLEQFVKYRNPDTTAEEGLRRRREKEAKIFCTPAS